MRKSPVLLLRSGYTDQSFCYSRGPNSFKVATHTRREARVAIVRSETERFLVATLCELVISHRFPYQCRSPPCGLLKEAAWVPLIGVGGKQTRQLRVEVWRDN